MNITLHFMSCNSDIKLLMFRRNQMLPFTRQNIFILPWIYKTLVLPIYLYGSEKWTLTALQRRIIEEAEMKLLRPLAGYTLYDHKTNDSVRRELQTECILDKIEEYRCNWLLHLQRMPPKRIPLKSYHYRPQGRRTIGRPKKRWREHLQLWRRNGSKGPTLDVYDDDDEYEGQVFRSTGIITPTDSTYQHHVRIHWV